MASELILVTDGDKENVRRQEAEILDGLGTISENLSFLATTLEQAVQLLIEAETDVKDDDLRHRIDVFLKKE